MCPSPHGRPGRARIECSCSLSQTGFTLVELLIVIGIIALLIAILMPGIARARAQGQRIACLQTLRQFGLADVMYQAENKGWHIPLKVGYKVFGLTTQPPPPVPYNPADEYARAWYTWPAVREKLGLAPFADEPGRLSAGLICPRAVLSLAQGDANGYPIGRSYGYNSTGLTWDMRPPAYHMGWHPGEIRNSASKLMIADATDWHVNRQSAGRYDALGEDYGPPDPVKGTRYAVTAYRHEGGANVVFFDGHAAWMPKSEVFDKDDPNRWGWADVWEVAAPPR
jgi:prepilin-type processing-associated H-X9-DG protein/prepilin-type N-terminal cleavage/methylation domain-containing protein